MSKLYIFAIGGTGSRVLKSLTMLLASGVKTRNAFDIVPIIIDPHAANEDLKRTKKILSGYQNIRKKLDANNLKENKGFFHHKITTLDELDGNLSDSFSFGLQDVTQCKFGEYLDYDTMGDSNKDLAELLFSGKSINSLGNEVSLLDVDMDIGFVGNPNIGSVVLNQFKDSEEFKVIASQFNEGDRFFIISSIFGGTGAAGFPTIIKNLRNAIKTNLPNKQIIADSSIGAISVMPYFNIMPSDDSPIKRADFIAKTKSALSYYKDNLTGQAAAINRLYYVMDDFSGTPFENDAGNNGQKNNAHFIELVSALSIIDFMGANNDELSTVNGKAQDPVCKEFSTRSDIGKITFSDLNHITEELISNPLASMMLFKKYLDENIDEVAGDIAWSKNNELLVDSNFLQSTFYRTHLKDFLNHFKEMIEEMSATERSFSPFNIGSDIATLISGKEGKAGWLNRNIKFDSIDAKLNSNSKDKTYSSVEDKLIALFSETMSEVLEENYKIN
jgi:hypothetical protein